MDAILAQALPVQLAWKDILRKVITIASQYVCLTAIFVVLQITVRVAKYIILSISQQKHVNSTAVSRF